MVRPPPSLRLYFTTLTAIMLTFTLPVSAFAGSPSASAEPAPTTVAAEPEPDLDAPEVVEPAPEPLPPPVLLGPAHPHSSDAAPKKHGRNHGRGWAFMGFGMFGTSYVGSAIMGTVAMDNGDVRAGRPMLIPIVGPFIAGARMPNATNGFLVGAGGVFQAAGLAIGIVGAVMLGKARRADRLAAGPNGIVLRF